MGDGRELRVQIFTIADLLDGKQIDMPPDPASKPNLQTGEEEKGKRRRAIGVVEWLEPNTLRSNASRGEETG